MSALLIASPIILAGFLTMATIQEIRRFPRPCRNSNLERPEK